MTTDIYSPPRLSLFRLFLRFLRFGALAFGGPVAQIAMVKQALVEEERWISPARFNRLLAVMQMSARSGSARALRPSGNGGPRANRRAARRAWLHAAGLRADAGRGVALPGLDCRQSRRGADLPWRAGRGAGDYRARGAADRNACAGRPAIVAACRRRTRRDAGGSALLDTAGRVGADLYTCNAARCDGRHIRGRCPARRADATGPVVGEDQCRGERGGASRALRRRIEEVAC